MSATKRARTDDDDLRIAPECLPKPDVELVAKDGIVIDANSALLCCASEYFKAALSGEFLEARERRINLQDVGAPELKMFLEFIRPASDVKLTVERACTLLPVFDRFQCPSCLRRADEVLAGSVPCYRSESALTTLTDLLKLSVEYACLAKTRMAVIHGLDEFIQSDGTVLDILTPFVNDAAYTDVINELWPVMRTVLLPSADVKKGVLLSPPRDIGALWPIFMLSTKREQFIAAAADNLGETVDLDDVMNIDSDDPDQEDDTWEGNVKFAIRHATIQLIRAKLPGERTINRDRTTDYSRTMFA